MTKAVGIIPCYNVECFCEEVIRSSVPYFTKVVIIDDGSTDQTRNILERLSSEIKKLSLVIHETNLGKGFAVLSGLKLALQEQVDALVILDSDLQHLCTEIPHFIQAIEQGADFVIGQREFREMPFRSKFSNWIVSFLLRRVYPKAPKDTQSGFRSFSLSFAKKILAQIPGGRYEMEFRCLLLALKDRHPIKEIPISTIYIDQNRSSHFGKVRDSLRILRVLFQYVKTGKI